MKRSIEVELFGQKFQVNFPNNGQLIDIETKKMALSNGMYGQLLTSRSKTAETSLDLIDSFATFSVLIPDFLKKINKDSLFDLDFIDSQEMIVIYKNVWFPFFNNWIEVSRKKAEELEKLYTEKSEG